MANGKQTVFSGWVLTFRKWDRRSERRPERFPGQRRDDHRQNEDQLRRHLFELSRRSFGQKTTDHSLPRFSIVSRKKTILIFSHLSQENANTIKNFVSEDISAFFMI